MPDLTVGRTQAIPTVYNRLRLAPTEAPQALRKIHVRVRMKPPEECANLQEVRAAIDDIDHDIIALICQRRGYVQAASAFKTGAASVNAPDRVAAMLVKRREWRQTLA